MMGTGMDCSLNIDVRRDEFDVNHSPTARLPHDFDLLRALFRGIAIFAPRIYVKLICVMVAFRRVSSFVVLQNR